MWSYNDPGAQYGQSQRHSSPAVHLQLHDYTVGWICALSSEVRASIAMLDSCHPQPRNLSPDAGAYTFGSVGQHNVVVACLPRGVYGTNAATTVATNMQMTFPNLRFGLMVGIGGGIPVEADVRLGDVVVSVPHGTYGGVVQWDMGKATDGQVVLRGHMNSPPDVLLQHLNALGNVSELIEKHLQVFDDHAKYGKDFSRPSSSQDHLFESGFAHIAVDSAAPRNCDLCLQLGFASKVIRRSRSSNQKTMVHYGTILSGNQVIADAELRDRLGRQHKALCFEMEAAGLMRNFPSLVIRGICDYSDTHNHDEWQGFAAATAAAFTKILLMRIPPAPSIHYLNSDHAPQHRYPSAMLMNNYNPWQQGAPTQSQPIHYPYELPQSNPNSLNSWNYPPQPPLYHTQPHLQSQTRPQYPNAFSSPSPTQPPSNQQPAFVQQHSPQYDCYADMMVAQGRGHEKPRATDPIGDKVLPAVKRQIIFQRSIMLYWSWSEESNFHSLYSQAWKHGQDAMAEHALASRFHGV